MIGIDSVGNRSMYTTSVQEGSTSPTPPPITGVPEQQSGGKPAAPVRQDQVVLSEQSRELSRREAGQRSAADPAPTPEESPATRPPETKTLTAAEVIKYFPPFLDATRRQEMLLKHPEFRKQIDQMTVPPPLDLSAIRPTEEPKVKHLQPATEATRA